MKKLLVAAALALGVMAVSGPQASAACRIGFSAGVSFNIEFAPAPWSICIGSAGCPSYGAAPFCPSYGYPVASDFGASYGHHYAAAPATQPAATRPAETTQAAYYPNYGYQPAAYGYAPTYGAGYGFGHGAAPSYWYGN